MTTWCKLKQVERKHRVNLDTRDVAESQRSLLAIGLRVEDDERTATLAPATTSYLTLTGSQLLTLLDLGDVGCGTNLCEQLDGGAGLGELEGGGGDDEWDFWNAGDAVTTGEEERCAG